MLPNNRRQAVAIAALKRGCLLASHVWRQDHNGFTHHDPGLIDLVKNKKAEIVRVYLPPDANYPNHSPASWEGDVGVRGRWRAYNYDQLIARDKASLDIFWLKDESLEDSDNLPAPEVWRPAPSSCSALSKEQTQPRIR